MLFRFGNVGLIDEVVLGLLDLRVSDDVAVGEGLLVVLIAFDGFADGLYYSFGLRLVSGLLRTQRGDAHVVGHGRHAGAHVFHVHLFRGIRAHIHAGHGLLGNSGAGEESEEANDERGDERALEDP